MLDAKGFTLAEVLVALFLIALGVLAAAPMFVLGMQGNDASADLGSVGAIAVEQMESLRAQPFSALATGGSLTTDVSGYSDTSDPRYTIRWEILDNGSPSQTKTIRVRTLALGDLPGPRRQVTLVSIRGM